MNYPTFEDVKVGMNVLVELKNDRGTGKLTEGIVEEKISTDNSDPIGIIVDIGNDQLGRVREILDYAFVDKNNTDPVISIIPNQGLSNRRKIIEFLSEAEDFIYIIVGYWKNHHFDILREVLDNNDSVKEIKIISTLPFLQTDRMSLDKKEFELILQYGNLFRDDLKFKKISVNFKFLTEKKVGREIHDRFYFTKNKSYNFIDLDILLKNQRADISRTDNGADFEKKLNGDFNQYWDYPTTLGIFGKNNEELLQERLDELENNRLKQLEDETKRLKKKEEKNERLKQLEEVTKK
jgi:uncharacterized repeat protein (TIGR03833 family)